MSNQNSYIPVYGPDFTQMGHAEVNEQGSITTISIEVPTESKLGELVKEELVGLSVIYLNKNAVEETINKEKTDGSEKE